MKRTVKEWNLDRDIYLNTKVIAAEWQEASGEWKVTVENEGKKRVEHCDILISGQGVLVYVHRIKISAASSVIAQNGLT